MQLRRIHSTVIKIFPNQIKLNQNLLNQKRLMNLVTDDEEDEENEKIMVMKMTL